MQLRCSGRNLDDISMCEQKQLVTAFTHRPLPQLPQHEFSAELVNPQGMPQSSDVAQPNSEDVSVKSRGPEAKSSAQHDCAESASDVGDAGKPMAPVGFRSAHCPPSGSDRDKARSESMSTKDLRQAFGDDLLDFGGFATKDELIQVLCLSCIFECRSGQEWGSFLCLDPVRWEVETAPFERNSVKRPALRGSANHFYLIV